MQRYTETQRRKNTKDYFSAFLRLYIYILTKSAYFNALSMASGLLVAVTIFPSESIY